ncbi:phosphotransferase [Mesorhizobium onobrychidis]|nr:phosphotransferase [Mesorhizobium onobrychidis]
MAAAHLLRHTVENPCRYGSVMTTDPLPRPADAEHLTKALRRSGAVGTVCVSNVVVMSSLKKLRSHTLRLHLDYEGPAGDAPSSVILKMGHLDSAGHPSNTNDREIAFYRDIAPALPARVVPHCFEAIDAAGGTAWHLLLEDLTDSHFIATAWPLPPSLEQCESIVQAWARFHAAWWDHPRLGVSVGDATSWERHLGGFAERFECSTDRFGEFMPRERRDLYERLIEQTPLLLGRTRRNLTVIHGDAHWWNCFLPRPVNREGVRFIDWESWHIGTATMDLAYMMAMLWYPDRRRRMERPLLDLYHAELLTRGVSGYDRQALGDDYRLSALWLITRPVAQAMNNIPPRVWWNNLERIMLAVDDLGCRDLLS